MARPQTLHRHFVVLEVGRGNLGRGRRGFLPHDCVNPGTASLSTLLLGLSSRTGTATLGTTCWIASTPSRSRESLLHCVMPLIERSRSLRPLTTATG